MLKSLRYRLLIWFIFSTILIAVLSFLLFHVHKSNKSAISLSIEKLEFLRYQFIKDQKQIARFAVSDLNNDMFYLSGQTENLDTHYQLINSIDSCFVDIFTGNSRVLSDLNQSLFSIRSTYIRQSMLLDSLVYNYYQRGYHNFGLVGQVNACLYRLEKSKYFPPGDVLNLKLASQAYFLDKDTVYLKKIDTLCSHLQLKAKNNRHNKALLDDGIGRLNSYCFAFHKIASIDRRLKELTSQLDEYNIRLDSSISKSIQSAKYSFNVYVARLNIIFGLGAFLMIAVSFVLSVYTSRYLVQNLEQLTKYISTLTHSNFKARINLDMKHSTHEIRQIYIEFRNMIVELHMREQQRDMALKVAQENQQRYRELADLLPQSVYETDRSGNLIYVNQAWYNNFGYGPKDIEEGINIRAIINSELSGHLMDYSKSENNDCKAIRKDGSSFPATIYSDVIKKGLKVVGKRGIIVDSTLRRKYIESLKKEADRAITSDQHKSSFLANMSHEIRTPMNAIIGFSNMLSSKEIPENQKTEFIHHIQSSSEMLLGLVDDIIDIAKIEASQLKIRKTDCKVQEILKDLKAKFEAFKIRLEKEELDIELDLPGEEIYFRTDEFRLIQILSNLISNAIKFTEKGNVVIGFKVKNARMLEFYVKDTGIGMSRDELTTIFERFKRSKISEEKKISGTGLGLAISKNLVELLGGRMWVNSETGQGTCFTFEVPYLRIDNRTVKSYKPTEGRSYNWQDKTILIAEDDEKGFNLLQVGLQPTHANIIYVNNGKDAVEALKFYPQIDVVLMDMQMPVLNGLEATIRIKEINSGLPVIAQTAFAMEGDKEKCLVAGCDDYITKPICMPDMLAKIAQFVDKPKQQAKAIPDELTDDPNHVKLIQQTNKNNPAG
jgi:PAS domain S-box-containing protein